MLDTAFLFYYDETVNKGGGQTPAALITPRGEWKMEKTYEISEIATNPEALEEFERRLLARIEATQMRMLVNDFLSSKLTFAEFANELKAK